MKLLKPSQSENKYIPLDLIETGGMAEVYRCKLSVQQGFEKITVLKKLLPQASHNPEIMTNFVEESKLTALLQYENIAHIFGFGFGEIKKLFHRHGISLQQRPVHYNTTCPKKR